MIVAAASGGGWGCWRTWISKTGFIFSSLHSYIYDSMNCGGFLPSANPILAFVAAQLICEQHTKHVGVVESYQLWQVRDTRVTAKESNSVCWSMLRVCELACVLTTMRVTELVCCSAMKYPEMACLQGFVKV